jgi:hypothetical protein
VKRNLPLLLIALVCAVSLWAGLRGDGTPEAAPAAAGPAPAVHLRILNGTAAQGLAGELGRELGATGLVIEGVGNAERPAVRSVLVNRRLGEAQAGELAERLGGLPVIREWDGRCTEDAVLVLGEDWPSRDAARSR